jgi:hypothetical protein
MSKESKRRAVLLGCVVLLAIAVVLDRTGVLRGGGGDGVGDVGADATSMSAGERYRMEAAALAAQRAAVERSAEMFAALELAGERWNAVRRTLVEGDTRPLAFSNLRTSIRDRLRAAGVLNAVVREEAPARAMGDGGGEGDAVGDRLLTLAASVEFSAAPGAVYEAIAALETMTRPGVSVTSVSIDGPGSNRARRTVDVRLTVRAVGRLTAGDVETRARGVGGGSGDDGGGRT